MTEPAYDKKYIHRLAMTYIEKCATQGLEMAKAWYEGLLGKHDHLREQVRFEIRQELHRRKNKK